MLYFITGNKGKFREVASILPIKQLEIDLVEIQELEVEKIITAKLEQALKHLPKGNLSSTAELMVEDTGLYLACLNGLPGPLVKWFLQAIGNQGLVDLAMRFSNQQAVAKTVLGYIGKDQEFKFFSAEVRGTIVASKGENSFGWDQIFQPAGSSKTFAQMSKSEKSRFSMRAKAVLQLKEFLG